ncbi:MAG TPA: hypothetical protein VGJ03_10915 [Acidimicrobiales bacterium]|jgi:hypothetical protein
METVIAWIRRLGNTGAVANARVLADQRAAEVGTIEALLSRLDGAMPVSDRPASAA